MKKSLKKAVNLFRIVICCGLLFAVVLNGFTVQASTKTATKPKENILTTFYTEPKDSADVVFIGSSSIYRYISTAQLYKKYGITSLNYAAASLDVRATAGLIDEVIDHQHPKVVVVEMRRYIKYCDTYVKGSNFSKQFLTEQLQNFKNFVYNMPASENRSKVIKDVVKPTFGYNAVKWEIKNFYPKYNNKKYTVKQLKNIISKNYKDVRAKYTYTKDSSYVGSKYKGTVGSKAVMPVKEVDFSNYTATKKIEGEWLDVLNDIIAKAKSCGTEVMFVSTPYVTTKKNVAYENAMGKIITDNGLKYLNCNKLYKKIGLNFSYDFYNAKHTNVNGMVKVTNYIGKYLVKNYGLEKSSLTKSQKKQWNTATKLWVDEVYEPMLKKVKKIKAKLKG